MKKAEEWYNYDYELFNNCPRSQFKAKTHASWQQRVSALCKLKGIEV